LGVPNLNHLTEGGIETFAPEVHPKSMNKMVLKLFALILLITSFPAGLSAQKESEENPYDTKFFDQLRSVFGKFRNADLQHAFRDALEIHCSELVGRKGEWRPVAFFNEDRTLGDWYRQSLEEVKSDLTVYTFMGACTGDKGTIRVATEFPTEEGLTAYNQRRVDLNHIDITVNDPAPARVNPETQAYTFDLPYLFLKKEGSRSVYSFMAPNRNSSYAPNVSSRWECKAVSSNDLTYRFLICRVSTTPRRLSRNMTTKQSFGSSAFFILSDGLEGKTSVRLIYGDGTDAADKPAEQAPTLSAPNRPVLKRDKTSPRD
jgi:hypothetical protein